MSKRDRARNNANGPGNNARGTEADLFESDWNERTRGRPRPAEFDQDIGVRHTTKEGREPDRSDDES